MGAVAAQFNFIFLFLICQDRVALIGHSAGAHLCMMASLELTLKRLVHNPASAVLSAAEATAMTLSRQSSLFTESIRFEDKYFNGSQNGENGDGMNSASTTGSFYLVDSNRSGQRTPAESFPELGEDARQAIKKETLEDLDTIDKDESDAIAAAEDADGGGEVKLGDGGGDGEGSEAKDSQAEIMKASDAGLEPPRIEIGDVETEQESELFASLTQDRDLLSSLKLVIGNAKGPVSLCGLLGYRGLNIASGQFLLLV